MRRIERIGKRMLAAVAMFIMTLPLSSGAADSGRVDRMLDSRTVPHPEWAQISGQIEQTSELRSKNGDALLRAIMRPTEGGHVTVDFGPAAASSFRPKQDDFIHVRSEAIEREGQVTMIAREVYAEGKVFPIQQGDEAAAEAAESGAGRSEESLSPSPAAPAPRER